MQKARKEKYGGTGDTPENAIDLPAREMTTIQVVKFPWDSNESYENKDKITQETLAIAIRYYYDFDNGAGPEFDMKYRFLFGTPHTITYKLYGEPGGTEYIVSVRLNKSSYRVDYHIVYN